MSSAALGAMAAATAVAGELPAVSAVNGKVAIVGGAVDADGRPADGVGLALGSLTLPVGASFGLQFDGLAGYYDGDAAAGFGAHLFWRDPEVALFGLTGSFSYTDSDSSSSSTSVVVVGGLQTTTTTTEATKDREVVRLGGEGEYYLGPITLGGHAGYQFGEGVEDGFYSYATLRGYPDDDLALSLGGRYDENAGFGVSFGAEYRPDIAGLPGLALLADTTVGEDDLLQGLVGVRYYFGPSTTLIDRHRRDDPAVNLVQEAVGSSPAQATVSTTTEKQFVCFAAGTQVLMADGTTKSIEAIVPGDCVLGAGGEANRVLEVETPLLGDRPLYAFNGGRPFVTADHPLMTTGGWKAVAPTEATLIHRTTGPVGALREGDELVTLASVTRQALPLAVGAEPQIAIACTTRPVRLAALTAHEGDPTQPVYDLRVAGNHTYFADGYLAHNK